jgi:hypothetical protein
MREIKDVAGMVIFFQRTKSLQHTNAAGIAGWQALPYYLGRSNSDLPLHLHGKLSRISTAMLL